MAEEKEKALKCLRQLRGLLMDDEDLKAPIHDEKFLIRFVRAKKYDAELAYQMVKKYYSLRKKNSKFAKCLYPSYEPVKSIFENKVIAKLKSNDAEGRTVIVYQNELWDQDKFSMDHMIAAMILLLDEIMISSVEPQLNGIVCVVNVDNTTARQMQEYSIARIKAILNLWQGGSPVRPQAYYLVRENAMIDIVIGMARPFFNEKTRNRLFLFGHDMEKLHEKVSPEILPKSLGGMLEDDKAFDTDLVDSILSKDSYYKDLMEYGFGKCDSDEEDTYM